VAGSEELPYYPGFSLNSTDKVYSPPGFSLQSTPISHQTSHQPHQEQVSSDNQHSYHQKRNVPQHSPETGYRSLNQARSFQKHPSSLSPRVATAGQDGSSSQYPTAASFAPGLASDSRRRAFSDAPHRSAEPSKSGSSVNVWEERTPVDCPARRLAPLPQGRRIELPPLPTGLAAAPSSATSVHGSRLSSPPMPPIFASSIPSGLAPLRLGQTSDRRIHQEEEGHITDEERSNSSRSSDPIDPNSGSTSYNRSQPSHENSLPASPFPHLLPSSDSNPRGRSDSDPFFRTRPAPLHLARTPPINEAERNFPNHSYFSSRDSLSPIVGNSSRSVSMSKLSQSQDSNLYSSHSFSNHSTLNQAQNRQQFALPPLSSGLATSTPATSPGISSPSTYLDPTASNQFQAQSSQLKRPEGALRLPSFSQLSIDVQSRDNGKGRETQEPRSRTSSTSGGVAEGE